MSNPGPAIIPLAGNRADAVRVTAPADRIVAGDGEQIIRNVFESPDKKFNAGVWEAMPGRWMVTYTESEFCYLLTGKVTLADFDGRSWTFRAGEAFVVPGGFKGTFEVVEPAQKYYAVYEPGA